MFTINECWQQLLTLGVSSDQEEFEIKHIKLLNAFAAFCGFLSLVYFFIEIAFYPLTKLLMFAVAVNAVLFFSVLWLNHRHDFLAARLLFNLSALVFISVYVVLLGPDVSAHDYFILIIGTAFFIYPANERNYQIAVVMLSVLSFVGFEIGFYLGFKALLEVPEQLQELFRLIFNVGKLFFVVGFCYYISEHYKRAENLLALERKYSDSLLHNILPESIVKRLKQEPDIIADRFEATTILFADIVGFTQLSEKLAPDKLVERLNVIFSIFDDLTEHYGLEKIKTIGDAYMVAGGLPEEVENHAQIVADLALAMRSQMAEYNFKHQEKFNVRIGIHTGSVIAGVIGIKKFVYDIWGDTVNVASRMESHGVPGEIQVSESTYQLLREQYLFEARGLIPVKGKGDMSVYLLKAKKNL